MKLPEPVTQQEQELYRAYQDAKQKAAWARKDYLALFPKKHKSKSEYDVRYEHDMDLIEQNPPKSTESQAQYYTRVKPKLSKQWFGRVMHDMGYERVSVRTSSGIIKVWK